MSTETAYADADEARNAYLEGELTEEQLEDVLDDESMHETDDNSDSWHDELIDALNIGKTGFQAAGVMLFMILWMTVGAVTLSLGESGAVSTEISELGGMLLGMTPMFPAAMIHIFDTVIEDASEEFRPVRHFRYLLSVGGAAIVYTSPAPTIGDLGVQALQIHEAMSFAAAMYVLIPAAVMWMEDNEDLVQKASRRVEEVLGS